MEFINGQEEENILIIKGVRRFDIFEEAVTEMLDFVEDDNVYYDKLPSTFTGPSEWPVSTNLSCVFDGSSFNSVPVFIPLTIRRDGTMEPLGCFCNYPCAIAYLLTCGEFDEEKIDELRQNVSLLYRVFNMTRVEYILPATKKLDIDKYGGDVNIDQWRDKQTKNIITKLPI
jgi:hypothetical protein